MEQHSGTSIFSGISIGRIRFYSGNPQNIVQRSISDSEAEICRLEKAKQKTIEELRHLYEKTISSAGMDNAMIFQMQILILDGGYYRFICDTIHEKKVNAEYAISVSCNHYCRKFSRISEESIKSKMDDIRDISRQLTAALTEAEEQQEATSCQPHMDKESIILAADGLTPGEFMKLEREKLLALVTGNSSLYSHTAILARTMQLPALTGIKIQPEWDGKMAILDSGKGVLFVEPDAALLNRYQALLQKQPSLNTSCPPEEYLPDRTKDGHAISLYANIGSISELPDVMASNAGGIGLFRSEFLYLEKNCCPSEEELFQVYRTLLQHMNGRRAVIRTFDIGGEKQVDYLNFEKETNPALGYRGIRVCLDRTDLFQTQLRAIYRASAYGNAAILFPMIISIEEIREIKKICHNIRKELLAADIPFGEVELGIMIETPAAVLISRELAKEVEFFSIGTNDLTQYTLAIDRENSRLETLYNPRHPAVLRMIQMVIEQAHQENCRVGICGELGADTSLTETLIRMGMDEFSVSPCSISAVRQKIRESLYQM